MLTSGQFHQEKLPSAISRYENEMDRITSVIELQLTRTGKSYLVGDKCTFADLMFVPWYRAFPGPAEEFLVKTWPEKYLLSYAWNQELNAREGVKQAQKVGDDFLASNSH